MFPAKHPIQLFPPGRKKQPAYYWTRRMHPLLDALFGGKAAAVVTVRRTVTKRRLSNPTGIKKSTCRNMSIFLCPVYTIDIAFGTLKKDRHASNNTNISFESFDNATRYYSS